MDTDEYMRHMNTVHSDGSECMCDGPVDLNKGTVVVDKLAKDNLSKVSENIKERFSLD